MMREQNHVAQASESDLSASINLSHMIDMQDGSGRNKFNFNQQQWCEGTGDNVSQYSMVIEEGKKTKKIDQVVANSPYAPAQLKSSLAMKAAKNNTNRRTDSRTDSRTLQKTNTMSAKMISADQGENWATVSRQKNEEHRVRRAESIGSNLAEERRKRTTGSASVICDNYLTRQRTNSQGRCSSMGSVDSQGRQGWH